MWASGRWEAECKPPSTVGLPDGGSSPRCLTMFVERCEGLHGPDGSFAGRFNPYVTACVVGPDGKALGPVGATRSVANADSPSWNESIRVRLPAGAPRTGLSVVLTVSDEDGVSARDHLGSVTIPLMAREAGAEAAVAAGASMEMPDEEQPAARMWASGRWEAECKPPSTVGLPDGGSSPRCLTMFVERCEGLHGPDGSFAGRFNPYVTACVVGPDGKALGPVGATRSVANADSPSWNESIRVRLPAGAPRTGLSVVLTVSDEDGVSARDHLGSVTIPLMAREAGAEAAVAAGASMEMPDEEQPAARMWASGRWEAECKPPSTVGLPDGGSSPRCLTMFVERCEGLHGPDGSFAGRFNPYVTACVVGPDGKALGPVGATRSVANADSPSWNESIRVRLPAGAPRTGLSVVLTVSDEDGVSARDHLGSVTIPLMAREAGAEAAVAAGASMEMPDEEQPAARMWASGRWEAECKPPSTVGLPDGGSSPRCLTMFVERCEGLHGPDGSFAGRFNPYVTACVVGPDGKALGPVGATRSVANADSPSWNESIRVRLPAGAPRTGLSVVLTVSDEDGVSARDHLGSVTIPLMAREAGAEAAVAAGASMEMPDEEQPAARMWASGRWEAECKPPSTVGLPDGGSSPRCLTMFVERCEGLHGPDGSFAGRFNPYVTACVVGPDGKALGPVGATRSVANADSPSWNESIRVRLPAGAPRTGLSVVLTVSDEDGVSARDHLGSVTIPLMAREAGAEAAVAAGASMEMPDEEQPAARMWASGRWEAECKPPSTVGLPDGGSSPRCLTMFVERCEGLHGPDGSFAGRFNPYVTAWTARHIMPAEPGETRRAAHLYTFCLLMAAASGAADPMRPTMTPALGAERHGSGLGDRRSRRDPADPAKQWFSATSGSPYNELPTFPVRPSYAKYQSSLHMNSQCVVFDGAPGDPHRAVIHGQSIRRQPLCSHPPIATGRSHPTRSMQIADVRALAKVCEEAKVIMSIDASMVPPVLMQCIPLGADIVVHSATKFLAGHSDTMAGVVCCRTEELAKRVAFYQNAEGTGLAPFDCWLVLRGIKTMALRVERAQSNAEQIALKLRKHPRVTAVHYAGLRPLAPDEEKALIIGKRAALSNSEVVKRRQLTADRAKPGAGAAAAPLGIRHPSDSLLEYLRVDIDKTHPLPTDEELEDRYVHGMAAYDTHFKQASGGGTVMSFTTGSVHLSQRIVDALRMFKLTVSFGSCNSLVEMPCVLSHASVPAEQRTIPEDLIRLSVGVEDVRDLLTDLMQAFELATHPHVHDVRLVSREGSHAAQSGPAGSPVASPSDGPLPTAAEVEGMRRQLALMSERVEVAEARRAEAKEEALVTRVSASRVASLAMGAVFVAGALAAGALIASSRRA
ncbi:hypothetical protein FNF28_07646 [Cafeteria roenbergensis]|uniref:cysteine-S-conjugate beta-lyase n=1 Tax=Cafeteria roenbergensis TaxID=33653 RepID=A0A5A8C0T5_CAFRO|nr:hypothetical protein FNF28_07646 [Cafeteria roenbergensis]